jgi:hypothetical protein
VANTAVDLLALTHLFRTAASECGFNPKYLRRKRWHTRIQDRSIHEIAARASQYLEGENGAEEFRERLLRAIAHADEDALIFLAKAIADNAEEMD